MLMPLTRVSEERVERVSKLSGLHLGEPRPT
jgi:hypothetical protein